MIGLINSQRGHSQCDQFSGRVHVSFASASPVPGVFLLSLRPDTSPAPTNSVSSDRTFSGSLDSGVFVSFVS